MEASSKFYHLVSELFWYMPNGKKQENEASRSDLAKLFVKFEITTSVTFFGGSFNPLHKGHLECLRLCPEENIVVIPDCNPYKVQSDLDRAKELINLAQELKDFKCNLYPAFFLAGVPNPTSSWITQVKVPEVNFLMGDDSFMSLMKWIKPEEFIGSLTKLYVVPRHFENKDYLPQIQILKGINPKLEVIILADHAYKEVSSRQLREK